MRLLRPRLRRRRVPSIVGGGRSARMRWWRNLSGGMLFEFCGGAVIFFLCICCRIFLTFLGEPLDWIGLVHTGTGITSQAPSCFYFILLTSFMTLCQMSMMVSPIAINHTEQLTHVPFFSIVKPKSAMANIGLQKKAQHTAPQKQHQPNCY